MNWDIETKGWEDFWYELIIIIIIIIGRFISPTPGTVGLKFKTNIGRYIKASN